jgi:hypothetical protein
MLVGSVLLIILVFCVVLFLLYVFALCFVCPMLPVFFDCQFVIVPSVFSNAYLSINVQSYAWKLNILTNRLATIGIYSDLIPRYLEDLSLIDLLQE